MNEQIIARPAEDVELIRKYLSTKRLCEELIRFVERIGDGDNWDRLQTRAAELAERSWDKLEAVEYGQ